MTTVLIIVCVVLCVLVVLAIVGGLGIGIASDKSWRTRIWRHHSARGRRSRLRT
jgi:preprotein translocase subunit SecG